MGEHLFRIDISELTRVRVTCKACNTTTEVAPDKIGAVTTMGVCRHCNSPFHGRDDNPFQQLGRAIQVLSAMNKVVAVEFSVPLDGGS